jgi:hypothetical protein
MWYIEIVLLYEEIEGKRPENDYWGLVIFWSGCFILVDSAAGFSTSQTIIK